MDTCCDPLQFKRRAVGTKMPISVTEQTIDGTLFVAESVTITVLRVVDNMAVVSGATVTIDNQTPNASHSYSYLWDTTGYTPGSYMTTWIRTAADGTVNVIEIAAQVLPTADWQ